MGMCQATGGSLESGRCMSQHFSSVHYVVSKAQGRRTFVYLSLGARDNTAREMLLFAQFSNSAYYTFILRNTGIPDNYCLINVAMDARENLPDLPGIYEITPTGVPNLVNLKYGSPVAMPEKLVEQDVMDTLARLRKAGTVYTTTPEIALFSSHTPFELTVPASAIKNGFYKELNGLHGHRNTYYTGAAFQAHDASLIWEYTNTILDKIIGR